MSLINKIVFAVIAISITFTVIISSYNIVFRMPDMYSYEFNKKQIADQIDLGIKDDEIAAFFSDYMFGKLEDFDLFTEYRDREQSVFGNGEQIAMSNAREVLNKSLFALGFFVLVIIISYSIMIYKNFKREVRIAYKVNILTFVVVEIILLICFFIEGIRNHLYNIVFVNKFGADDALATMLTYDFAKACILASICVSIVLLIIFGSLTWKITKPRRIFWKD